MNEDAYVSDEEELECPLCMEEFDISDRTFKPCPCGYQICRFCYNRIVNSETANGCPACRRQYTEETVEFKPLSAEEWKKDQQRIHSRKLKEKEKRESEMASRRHLSNMRVVQKNLVYVIGFSPKSADADLAATLRGNDYFAQYGKINKIVVNKKSHPNGQPTVGVYITYARKEDAARAVQAVDNTINDGRVLRASFGTTKYCSAYLRQQICQNPNCMYLHEPGEDLDSYTREDMSTIQHAAKAAEGMHANALAAHHMRRQPTRTDSSSTMNQDESTHAAALPPTASWASLSKGTEGSNEANGTNIDHSGPESLPPPSRGLKDSPGEIPPPPSQAVQGATNPSELLPLPVQPGLSHSILGSTLKTLFEGRFNFDFAPRVMPGLSEADIKSAENFPQLFAWNPHIVADRRPSSPSKSNKNHARSGSRYAFAADTKTPSPGFIPPGLATGLQPPGFTTGGQGPTKEAPSDFFSQLLQGTNSTDSNALLNSSTVEESTMIGLREPVASPSFTAPNVVDVVFAPRPMQVFSSPVGKTQGPTSNVALSDMDMNAAAATKIRPIAIRSSSFKPEPEAIIHEDERLQSTKFGANFAKLESLESQAKDITSQTDQKARGSWEPSARPRELGARTMSNSMLEHVGAGETTHHQLNLTKSSGTWQPSPPPPRIHASPSPKPSFSNLSVSQKLGTSLRSASKVPWEPSPPPTTQRTASPLKTSHDSEAARVPKSNAAQVAASHLPDASIKKPIPIVAEPRQSILVNEDFPALQSTVQPPRSEGVTHLNGPAKRVWEPVIPVAASPILSQSPKPQSILTRRDSTQSVSSVPAGRSRQNSVADLPASNTQTPTRGLTPVTSPLSSRASSPVRLTTPILNRTTSFLSAAPSISSPLANLNTGKQIRIVSNKASEDSKAKADKAAAEERAIKRIKEDESAAAAKSMIRKSVPANSVKKTKEQKLAEQREKAEKRERESVVSSQPDDAAAPTTEIAPIIGRARKQKNKQVTPKANAKLAKQSSPPGNEASPQREPEKVSSSSSLMPLEQDEPPTETKPEDIPSSQSKTAASDAITELSREVDLRSFKFFLPIPGLNFNYHLTAEELAKGAELSQWPAYTGKETTEQLEAMLSQARREAGENLRALEKLQRRNIRLARMDLAIPV